MIRLITVTLFSLLSLAAQADIVKCTMPDGSVELRDTPCADVTAMTVLKKKRSRNYSIRSMEGDVEKALKAMLQAELKTRNEFMAFDALDGGKQQLFRDQLEIILKGGAMKTWSRMILMEDTVNRCERYPAAEIDQLGDIYRQYVDLHRDELVVGRQVAADGYSYQDKGYSITSQELENRIQQALADSKRKFKTSSKAENIARCRQLAGTLRGAVDFGL